VGLTLESHFSSGSRTGERSPHTKARYLEAHEHRALRLTTVNEYHILIYMTQRLQVLLDESEFAEIRRIARRHRMTVAEWVRQALRAARSDEPAVEPRRKLGVVREAARGEYPTADIGMMLTEIERGYLSDDE